MKRDWELIKNILNLVVSHSETGRSMQLGPRGTVEHIPAPPLAFCREYYSEAYYHALLLGDAGWAIVSTAESGGLSAVFIESLTNEGRSALALSQDQAAWDKAVAIADANGGDSFELMVDGSALKLLRGELRGVATDETTRAKT
jgi:hypothetical protein